MNNEQSTQSVASQRERLGRIAYRFRQNPLSVLGLAIIIALVLVAVFAPVIAPSPRDAGYQGHPEVHFSEKYQSPSLEYLFGTDGAGRDIFSRTIFGLRLSLWIGVVVLTLAVLVGVPVGLIAGYVGGIPGAALMRITDVFLSVPPLVLALGVSVALKANLTNAMIAIAAVWWPWYARLTYGEVVAIKTEEFVEASRGIGASSFRTIFREILPNVIAPITVKISLDMGYAILVAAALGFIGLGAQPPTPELGTMVSQGRNNLPEVWWHSTFPGLAIFVTVLGFNFLGDGLRDMFDVEVQ
ncbi:ABC transporter permease [Halocatena marina]|uniref:ABC transporter permease n=1 Tax=Halocatena marina TaxID=2934937 RepID=UPI00200BC10A|nr:ABC transporter permease [Halocatena marina]